MGDVIRAYRARRGELPVRETWDAIDIGPVGQMAFCMGRVAGSARRAYWRPGVGASPHGFAAGRTRLGKTSALKAWAMTPILHNRLHGSDWLPPIILDPKATGAFDIHEQNGAEVIRTDGAIKDRLGDLWEMAEARNRKLGKLVLPRQDRRGVARPFSPEKVWDLTPDEREHYGMRPVYLTFDELRDILGEGDAGTSEDAKGRATQRASNAKINERYTQLVQKAASAGIHIMAGVQQPRADVIGSYARDQMACRVMFGRADIHTVRMVVGEEEAKKIAQEAEVLDPGHGFGVGFSRDKIVERIYMPLLDLTEYGDFAVDMDSAEDRASLAEVAETIRLRSAPATHSGKSPPGGGSVPGGLRGAVAMVVGPVVRTGLRVGALKHVVGAVEAGPFVRRQEVVKATWEASRSGRCAACGRAGHLEVDHRLALVFGGADTTENTRLLCKRPGRASCHGAKTSAELLVLNARRRAGRAPGPKPPPLAEGFLNLVRLRRPWWWGLWGCLLLGLVWAPVLWQGLAVLALVILGPVWSWMLGKSSRKDTRSSPDGSVDPKSRRSPAIEYLKAKGGRGFGDRLKLKHHDRMSAIAIGRHYAIRVSGLFLLGAWAVWLITHGPVILWAIVRVLV